MSKVEKLQAALRQVASCGDEHSNFELETDICM